MLIDILFLFIKLIKYHNYQFKCKMRILSFHISRFKISFGFESIVRLDNVVDNAGKIMVKEILLRFTHFLKRQIR